MIGRLSRTLEVPNDQPWLLPFSFWTGPRRTVTREIVSADATMVSAAGVRFDMTVGNGRLSISGADVEIHVDLNTMGTLAPGPWELELRATDTTGVPLQVRGPVNIVERV